MSGTLSVGWDVVTDEAGRGTGLSVVVGCLEFISKYWGNEGI